MYRFMYCGYPKEELKIRPEAKVVTASVAYFENMAFLYYESRMELPPDAVVDGSLKEFPDGSMWFRMPEIFHYFSCEDDEKWERKEPNKEPFFRINFLYPEKVASYVCYHQEFQQNNPVGSDRYGSIYLFGNQLIMYTEFPTEKVAWTEIEGKKYAPCLSNWGELMNEHFKEWEDGSKGWRKCRNVY